MEHLRVTTKDKSYPIYFGSLDKLSFSSKVMVISNACIADMYLSRLVSCIDAHDVCVCLLNDGEAYKTMQSVERILESAFTHRLDRKSIMIALGGGVIGDIVGFASGIFMRGIDFVQIPTTLLAQVDASIGGKTGINNHFGKNLVGLFHQPASVHIDLAFLQTLPIREFNAGVAEIIKIAVMFDKDFFLWLCENRLSLDRKEDLLYAIRRAVMIKQDVVCKDEKEMGIRAALNYGHTFAHVIEKESGYGHYLHGEAVSMGIVMANTLACQYGSLQKTEAAMIQELLESYDLPTSYLVHDKEQFYNSLFLDKKSTNDKITFILPKSIGGVVLCNHFSRLEIMNVLEQFCNL